MDRNEIMELLSQSKDLPEVPEDILKLLDALDPTDCISIKDLCDKLSEMDGLEWRILAFINSKYFQLPQKVDSIKQAILLFGMRTIRVIIATLVAKMLIYGGYGKATVFNREAFWTHTLGTSVASMLLQERKDPADAYLMFAYGFIHDIGIAVMDICMPDLLDAIVTTQLKNNSHLVACEKQLMDGLTHADIGAWLCNKWRIPQDMISVVELHHSLLHARVLPKEQKVLIIGDMISTYNYERLLGLSLTNSYPSQILNAIGITHGDIEQIGKTLSSEVEHAKRTILL